jgi:hypothetical protein
MALVVKDRVRETSVTQGTGTFTLAGAVTGYQSFSAIGNGNTTYYTIYLQASNEWEVGIGTYTASGTTLSRDTILASSNGGSVVNFSAGTKDVFVTYPAGRSVYYDTATNVTVNQLSATTVDATNVEVTNIKAKDGTAALSIADSTGVVSVSANPVLSGGTANGVVYLNASKVATSGSALTFDGTTLGVTGVFKTFNSAAGGPVDSIYTGTTAGSVLGQFRAYGTGAGVTAESVFRTVLDGGSITSANFQWLLNNSEQMRLTSGGQLNLGGNFTSTNNTLQVTGNAAIGYTTAAPTTGLIVAGNVGVGTDAPRGVLDLNTTRQVKVYFGTAGTIGETQQNAGDYVANNLFVSAESAGTMTYTKTTGDNGNAIIQDFSRGITFYTGVTGAATTTGTLNNFERMRLDSSGNLGIGTNSPTAKLDVNGGTNSEMRLTTSGSGYLQIGQFTNGAFIGTSSSDATAGVLRFGTAGTAQMRLDTSGNLGLGVTPSAWESGWPALQVGTGAAVWSTSDGRTSLGSNIFVGSGPTAKYIGNGFASSYTQLNGVHSWSTAPNNTSGANANASGISTVMTLDTSGNLGLGVAPGDWNSNNKVFQLLHNASFFSRSGFTGVAQNFRYDSTDAGIFMSAGYGTLYYQNSGKHIWSTTTTSWNGSGSNAAGLSDLMTLDASGRLLIGGTSSPASSNIRLLLQSPNATSDGGAQFAYNGGGGGGGAIFSATGSGLIFFGYTGVVGSETYTERARITSGGDFRVKGAGTAGSTDAFQISGSAPADAARLTSDGNLYVGVVSPATAGKIVADGGDAFYAGTFAQPSSASNCIAVHNRGTSGDNAFVIFGTEAAFTTRGSIDYNRAGGQVRYNTTSDYRAKEVYGPVTDSGAQIDALKVYQGKMIGATQERPMMIAHEAQEVVPYAVGGEKDAVNDDGTPKYQTMDHQILVPLLIAELQSLRARVAQLEGK